MKHICLIGITAAALAVTTAGCRKTTATMERQPEPAAPVEVSPQDRAAKLSQRVEEFSREVAGLPGRNDQEYRQRMAAQFGDLSEILPMLEGPEPTGAFRQQIGIIQNTRSTLQSAPPELPVEPTVGLGLRAVENALQGIQVRTFYAHEEVAQALQPLRTRVAELDTARGPLNQLVAAQAMREAATVLYRMTSVIHDRAQVEQPSADRAEPVTQPMP